MFCRKIARQVNCIFVLRIWRVGFSSSFFIFFSYPRYHSTGFVFYVLPGGAYILEIYGPNLCTTFCPKKKPFGFCTLAREQAKKTRTKRKWWQNGCSWIPNNRKRREKHALAWQNCWRLHSPFSNFVGATIVSKYFRPFYSKQILLKCSFLKF